MKEKKILYFECSSGISGDMTLGALLDLGLDKEEFLSEIGKLKLSGYRMEFETVERNGVRANHVNVMLTGHDHARHEHRSFRDIRKMIEESQLKEDVKDLALRIFTRVARAEAKVHGKPVDEVHFHEVGAVDSIVDIVGSAILVRMLNPDEIYASVVQDGHGFINCQHGLLSVPVPAVSEIFAASGTMVRQIDVETELVTPTGAAIIAELAESYGPMPVMKLEKIGWGAGTKILAIPNVLKVYLGSGEGEESGSRTQREADAKAKRWAAQDEITVLETNLDDSTGEMMGYAMERLLEAGALDVFYTPIFMKKNRPAYKLTVLAEAGEEEKLEELIFTHTTTIGIRKRREQRSILKREKASVQTPFGKLEVKRVKTPEGEETYPEYESGVKLAKSEQVPLKKIYGSLYESSNKS